MRLVYPPDGHQTFETSTFIVGSCTAGSRLVLNGQAVPVHESGFFAATVPLSVGANTLNLVCRTPDESESTQTLTVTRMGPVAFSELPADPAPLLPFVFPQEDLGISPGETLVLVCPAPPGSKVHCRVEWLMNRPVEMTPASGTVDTREGVFARLHQVAPPWPEGQLFMAYIHVPVNTPPLPNLMVQFILSQGEQKLEFRAPGSVTILPQGKRPFAVISPTEAIVRTNPTKGARRAPLVGGTTVEICGFWGGAFRVRYGPEEAGWVDRDDLTFLDTSLYPSLVPVYLVEAQSAARALEVIIPLSRALPVDFRLYSGQIRLSLYGAASHCDFIHYQPGVWQQGLQQIEWHQTNPETVTLEIKLDSPLYGFQRYYDTERKALVLVVRTAKSLASFPMVVAIDPGHGGDEPGAMAPDGTPEKDLNLAVARLLQQHLSQVPELKVVLTRTEDVTVSLADRVAAAVAAEANLLISLHHNALPDGRDPLAEHGVSTFYYHPFALPMARRFQELMVKETSFRDYGVLYDSLHVCRVMEMPSLLLELGFLTHPADAARCLDVAHQQRVVSAIAKGVLSCLKVPKA